MFLSYLHFVLSENCPHRTYNKGRIQGGMGTRVSDKNCGFMTIYRISRGKMAQMVQRNIFDYMHARARLLLLSISSECQNYY